jgi:ABC-2 type transport system ATP-binding protein
MRPPERADEAARAASTSEAGGAPARAARAPHTPPAVEARGLHKSFPAPHATVHAVRGLDLVLAPGETVALLGPNGAGKSTTLDMVLGLCRPDEGTVRLGGMSPVEAVRAGQVAAMLQTGGLLKDLSVRELVELMASLYPAPLSVSDVLDVTGLTAIAGQRTQKLSGGQTQRVRFALALVTDARLLVLDEPTVGLDVEARRDFWRTIRVAAAAGKTVLFATHYLDEADANADRIVLMARGTVVADGAATEIKARIGTRTIRATLPHIDAAALATLPGVTRAERHGNAVLLACADSDAALRALLAQQPGARDIEVSGAGLEQAFLELTGTAGAGLAGAAKESA